MKVIYLDSFRVTGGNRYRIEIDTPEFYDRALCVEVDNDIFFPEKGGSTREAKRICLGCEVREECLEYALDNDERFGIWGGLSERERRKENRARGKEPKNKRRGVPLRIAHRCGAPGANGACAMPVREEGLLCRRHVIAVTG